MSEDNTENGDSVAFPMNYGLAALRSKIPEHFFYLNEQRLTEDGYDAEKLKISEAKEEYLFIKLAGLRFLARILGVVETAIKTDFVSSSRVVASCRITVKTPYGEREEFTDIAGASVDNTKGVFAYHLEAIAANRAFARTVKNYFGLNILSDAEIETQKPQPKDESVKDTAQETVTTKELGPHKTLKKALQKASVTIFKASEIIAEQDPNFFKDEDLKGVAITEEFDINLLTVAQTRILLLGVKKYVK